MGDLKGLLDKEGINISHSNSTDENINGQTDEIPYNNEPPTLTDDIDIDLINQFEQHQHEKQTHGLDTSAENDSPIDLPVLDGTITVIDQKPGSSELDDYISDIEDDTFDVMEFASSVEELEEKVGSITEPHHLQAFQESESQNLSIQRIKTELQNKLNQQIEQSIEELKQKLLRSIQQEIDALFKQ